MKKVLVVVLIISLMILAIVSYQISNDIKVENEVLTNRLVTTEKELAELKNQVVAFENSTEVLKSEALKLQQQIDELSEHASLHTAFTELDERDLMKKDVTVKEIFEVASKQVIIDAKPTLGGTFYTTRMVLINSELMFINFEDGHVDGYQLVRVSVEGDQISFENIKHYLYE